MSCFIPKEMECYHETKKVSLNNVGDYVVFHSECFHKGYYFIQAGTAVYTAQLFAKHSTNISQERMTRLNTPENSIMEGHVDDRALMEKLSTDLVRNWNTKFSWVNYPTCRFFGNEWIDEDKNRQIKLDQLGKKNLKIATIDNLVMYFQLKFPHLTIDSVWLIKKESVDHGFQGWHRDFKLGNTITTTIVVNVGAVTFK
jgi:hypothetical protein